MKIVALLAALTIAAPASSRLPFPAAPPPILYHDIAVHSLYLPMKDGVRLAIEVALPAGLPAHVRIPAILRITRYGRAPIDGTLSAGDRFFVQHGYARISVDERGTGASFGTLHYGPSTLGDDRAVLNWIVAQRWCNGRIGAIGSSYEGTTAELLAATGNPAVRAVAPLFSDYDYYSGVLAPGGIMNVFELKKFREITAAMDAGAAAKRVESDRDGTLLAQAVAEHKHNADLLAASRRIQFADDPVHGFGGSLRDMSIGAVRPALLQSRVPMLVFASWLDAATVAGTFERFRTYPNVQRVYVGPWSHGGRFDSNPFLAGKPARDAQPGRDAQRFEALSFFDAYLRNRAAPLPHRTLQYFTVGTNVWHAATTWPPANTHVSTYYLTDRALASRSGSAARRIRMQTTATGERSRWRSQLTGEPISYAAVMPKLQALPAFTSTPLSQPLTITGAPELHLRLRASITDPSVFAYLTAIGPNGDAVYLTDGQLRLIDCKIAPAETTLHSFRRVDARAVVPGRLVDAIVKLLPLSASVPRGWRLRVSFAANDRSNFNAAAQYDAIIEPVSHFDIPSLPAND